MHAPLPWLITAFRVLRDRQTPQSDLSLASPF